MAESNDKSLVNRILSGLKWASIAAFTAGCLSEQFPVSKEWEQPEGRRVSERLILSEQDRILYPLIGFSGNDIDAKSRQGRQIIARVNESHKIPNMPVGYKGGVLATVSGETLHYILEGDIRSFLEIDHNPVTNELQFFEYAVENGMVKTPLPLGYKPKTSCRKLAPGELSSLDKFLRENFEDTIFSENDVLADEYSVNPVSALIKLNDYIDQINTTKKVRITGGKRKGEERIVFDKCTFERAKILLDAAKKYQKIDQAGPGKNVAKRANILGRLENIYSNIQKLSMTGSIVLSPNYGGLAHQQRSVEDCLDKAKSILSRYLNFEENGKD